jgi:hypothetical protein
MCEAIKKVPTNADIISKNFFANSQALLRQAATAPRKEVGHNFEAPEKELSDT